MSLRVWLPLTKDLRNQGLDDVTVINNGATFNTVGKLGGSYTGRIDVSSSVIPTILNGSEFTVAFWIYINEVPTSSSVTETYIMVCGTGGTRTQFHIAIRQNGAGFAFCFYSDDYTFYNTVTDKVKKWMHVVCAFKDNTQIVYVDGAKIGERATAGGLNIAANKVLNIYAAHERLNDVRIYDHCLSPMEVKEISKGLVLHYPLSNKYLESTTNMITSEDCLSATCYNGVLGKYSYGSNTDMYKEVTYFEGRKGTKVYNKTNGTAMFPYIYINNMYTSDGTNSPPYKTLSFDYYTTISTSISPYKLGSGNGTATYIVRNSSGVETGTGVNSVLIPVVPNTWNHIEVTFHGTTAADSQWGYIINSPSHASNTDNFWFFANMQLETKDHATGYAGVGGTRNSNIVYDTSGFCNNGTISGTLTISNDTLKYKASTYMPAATTITHIRCLDNSDQEWSCAAWVKPKVAGNYQNLNNFNEFNRLYHGTYPLLYANTGTNDYYNYGNLALPVNQWSHIVFVFKNSTGTKLIYINGENHTNMTGPNKTSTPSGIPDNVIIGSGNYEGGLCDYREYATALSAEDVKSLYQNSAYIDNQGNIYGTVYEEV